MDKMDQIIEDGISRRNFIRAATGVGLGLVGISAAGCIEREEIVLNAELPTPILDGVVSLEEAIGGRRSERSFKDIALAKEQLSQILWAAQGITDPGRGLRAAPSAAAQYPLDVYAVVGKTEELDAGVYHYDLYEHSMRHLVEGDLREPLAIACLGQMFIADAPISIVIAAEYGRIKDVDAERGVRLAHMEAGHVGQNIYLQAGALGLGTVMIGGIMEDEVAEILHLPDGHRPAGVMPVGYVE